MKETELKDRKVRGLMSEDKRKTVWVGKNKKKQKGGQGTSKAGMEFELERQRGSPIQRPLSSATVSWAGRRAWLLLATHRATVTRGALLLPACLPLHIQYLPVPFLPPHSTYRVYLLPHTLSVSLHTQEDHWLVNKGERELRNNQMLWTVLYEMYCSSMEVPVRLMM